MANILSNNIFIYSSEFKNYKFSNDHPFDPLRIKLTYELLKSDNCLTTKEIVPPVMATEDDLLLAHRKDYVDFVKKQGPDGNQSPCREANQYGLCTDDTPIFPNMHISSSYVAGSTLLGAKHVLNGTDRHALNLSGGLHHATSGKASGFCVYNDINVAISYIRKHTSYKVLYIDTDAHHGDGVQYQFYDDPAVCTFSIHETGRYLFPGTGSVRERGSGNGYGFCFNLPLDAFTEDDSFKYVLENALYIVADYFKPDIIISQHGADGHFQDHMSHLSLTIESYQFIPKLIHKLSHEYCSGRWVATGGGGYNVFDVVPRVWALIWKEMQNLDFPDLSTPLPVSYLDYIAQTFNHEQFGYWGDDKKNYIHIPRRDEIYDKNKKSLIDSMYAINKGTIGNDFFSNRKL
ncbi:acetoin utilization protein AcuC [Alkalibacter mobilis]|uniref:acetoin utilization protein AcuC n=1 Tax=Alkalibacter mobilis TaxID=2787712 RepID=UPI00189FAE86|nr:acetoin utilization protein AcuC [Alkalibacter mobilis]MBF7096483.1 acetoin utilization protein AcuC [Alkalibacter mobilis]